MRSGGTRQVCIEAEATSQQLSTQSCRLSGQPLSTGRIRHLSHVILVPEQHFTHRAAAGLLNRLPIPHCPWSHISLDFVTGFPESDSNTVVLTIVDRFSKLVHFVPLPKLPSAKETAETLLHHVVKLHGFPVDVVSDRGPHFVSQFWKASCSLVGATELVVQIPSPV